MKLDYIVDLLFFNPDSILINIEYFTHFLSLSLRYKYTSLYENILDLFACWFVVAIVLNTIYNVNYDQPVKYSYKQNNNNNIVYYTSMYSSTLILHSVDSQRSSQQHLCCKNIYKLLFFFFFIPSEFILFVSFRDFIFIFCFAK